MPAPATTPHTAAGGRRNGGRGTHIDKVISWVVVTIAGILAVMAIIRFVMPPLADATNSVVSSRDSVNADINQVITIGAASMPDSTTVDIWAKNVGSGPIPDVALTNVAFGLESNAVPVPYGGPGCAAPCWSYDLGAAALWGPGDTLSIRVHLPAAAESGALHRVTVAGLRGGHATATVRAP